MQYELTTTNQKLNVNGFTLAPLRFESSTGAWGVYLNGRRVSVAIKLEKAIQRAQEMYLDARPLRFAALWEKQRTFAQVWRKAVQS
jgi:hypothetical protein